MLEIGDIVDVYDPACRKTVHGIVVNTKVGPDGEYLIAFPGDIQWIRNPPKAKKQTIDINELGELNPLVVKMEDLPRWSYVKPTWTTSWSFIGWEEFVHKARLRAPPLKRSIHWLQLAGLTFLAAMAIQLAQNETQPTVPSRILGWAGMAAATKFCYDYYTFMKEINA